MNTCYAPEVPPAAYLALRAKLDRFAADVAARQSEHMLCRAGCDGCCHTKLSLSDVEAQVLRDALAAMPAAKRKALSSRSDEVRCRLLDDAGRCALYDARPLVCRSQGLPLRYPPDTIPVESVRARAADAEVTWCPLNFEDVTPAADDILDAERVDVVLAVINRQVSDTPLRRTSIDAIVDEAAS
ncbi:MAG: YkgJ family cysteine cluster protein [Sandaracinaceae bacterium]